MVVGDNGVLKQTQNAKIKTEKAKDQELRGLTAAEAGGNLEMTWYQDKVPIPAGFAVSQVEGENRVEDGLVIIDSNGNEFVWIPCGTWDETHKKYSTTEYENAKDYVKEYCKTWTNPNEEIAKKSIEKYGGFYVARFEAGIPSNAPFYVSNTSGGNYVGIDGQSVVNKDSNARGADTETDKIKDLKPVSKRGVQAWNFISQTNAETVSKNMYKDNNTVDSYLIDSNAWNYICESKLKNIMGEEGLKNSTKYGNYADNLTTSYTELDCLWANHKMNSDWDLGQIYRKGNITSDLVPKGDENNKNRIELSTGASDDFKVYNIYDMAGNMWELNIDRCSNNILIRGGSFNDIKGNDAVVLASDAWEIGKSGVELGFRPVLYVK